ncbi:MAG TPA: hypothetical protein VLE97_11355 [Gaiellaceae bacterium]|nr:hypothetical protein [Gaiellaceae bacterium]
MRFDVDKNASKLIAHRHDRLLNDSKIPLSARQMISAHMAKPWIPRFWVVAIRPTGPSSESYLDFLLGEADGTEWHFPSKKWWVAHANASHPPKGVGCDVDVHVDFLTAEGATHEFDYATISTGRELTILHPDDFDRECRWWRAHSASRGRAR